MPCPSCGSHGAPGARFCDRCGAAMDAGALRQIPAIADDLDASAPSPATGGSSPLSSPTSSITSGWSPSTTPRRSEPE